MWVWASVGLGVVGDVIARQVVPGFVGEDHSCARHAAFVGGFACAGSLCPFRTRPGCMVDGLLSWALVDVVGVPFCRQGNRLSITEGAHSLPRRPVYVGVGRILWGRYRWTHAVVG